LPPDMRADQPAEHCVARQRKAHRRRRAHGMARWRTNQSRASSATASSLPVS
jgi:hypothetical protein